METESNNSARSSQPKPNGQQPPLVRAKRRFRSVSAVFCRRDEAVTATRQGFNPAWAVGGITKSFAQTINGRVKAVVKINKCVRRPQRRTQFFTANESPLPLQKHLQNLEGLAGKAQKSSAPSQLLCVQIRLKRAEADDSLRALLVTHKSGVTSH